MIILFKECNKSFIEYSKFSLHPFNSWDNVCQNYTLYNGYNPKSMEKKKSRRMGQVPQPNIL